MSRIIKFRAWDGASMNYKVNMLSNWGAIKEGYSATAWIPEAQAGEPMQYTGIKDRNGVEIYEGDIVVANLFYDVQKKELVYFKVVFDDGSYSLIDKKGIQFSLSGFNGLEVVGNIYENKELE